MTINNWNTTLYDGKHNFVTKYGEDLLGLLNAQAGERILDVGCGTGHLTAKIAESGATVIGLDNSAEMLLKAQAAYPHMTWVNASASNFAFDQPFDALYSNATLHWVSDAEGAVHHRQCSATRHQNPNWARFATRLVFPIDWRICTLARKTWI